MMNLEMVMSLMLRSSCPKPSSNIPSMVWWFCYRSMALVACRKGSAVEACDELVHATRVFPSLCRFLEVGFAFWGTSTQNISLGPSQKRFNLKKWA
jgi:hypothetical protein